MNKQTHSVVKFFYGNISPSNKLPTLVRWLLKKRIVRTERQALTVLVLLTIVSFSLAVYFAGIFKTDSIQKNLSFTAANLEQPPGDYPY